MGRALHRPWLTEATCWVRSGPPAGFDLDKPRNPPLTLPIHAEGPKDQKWKSCNLLKGTTLIQKAGFVSGMVPLGSRGGDWPPRKDPAHPPARGAIGRALHRPW